VSDDVSPPTRQSVAPGYAASFLFLVVIGSGVFSLFELVGRFLVYWSGATGSWGHPLCETEISIPDPVIPCGEPGYGFIHSMLVPLVWWIPLPIFFVSLAITVVVGRKKRLARELYINNM
jgi:hypothetical protein